MKKNIFGVMLAISICFAALNVLATDNTLCSQYSNFNTVEKFSSVESLSEIIEREKKQEVIENIDWTIKSPINKTMYTYNGVTNVYCYPTSTDELSDVCYSITNSNKVWAFSSYENGYTAINFNGKNGYVLTEKLSQVDPNMSEIDMLIEQANVMVGAAKIRYSQSGRQTATTVDGLNNIKKTDCSAFVYSMFKTYFGIDVGKQSEAIYQKAINGYTENGWKAQVVSFHGDVSKLQPGDILYRSGHVGIYVGNGLQIDHGGPGSANPSDSNSWRGPLKRGVSSSYTKAIRYTKM